MALKRNPVAQYFANIWLAINTTRKGMLVTISYFFRKPITELYPEEKPFVPEDGRGLHVFEEDKCIACKMCMTACPVDCLVIEWEGREYIVGVKNDLRQDMVRDWRRPRYKWEAGRIEVDAFETNGDFIYGRKEGDTLDYTIVNLYRALWNGQLLYQGGSGYFGLAFDGTPVQEDYGKSRYWRGRAVIGR